MTSATAVLLATAPAALSEPLCETDEIIEFIPSDTAGGDRFGTSVDLDLGMVIIGADECDLGAVEDVGAAYVYRLDASGWVESKLEASDCVAGDAFGTAVAVDQDVALIGACGANAAYIFSFNGLEWSQAAKLQTGEDSSADEFGKAVALSGDVAVIGARSADGEHINAGAAYVFRYDGEGWIEESKLTASDAAQTDYFGSAVSIWENLIIVGASYDDDRGTNSGSAYVFRYAPQSCAGSTCPWMEEAKLTAWDGSAGDYFGFAVALSDDAAVIGARKHKVNQLLQAGAAYVFRYDGSAWMQESKLTAFDAAPYDQFGYSVDIDGALVAVGAKGADNADWPDIGAAYTFRHDGYQWTEEAKHTASSAYWDEWLGTSVAVKGAMLVAGAEGTDVSQDGGFFSGSAFIFSNQCAPVACPADLNGDGLVSSPDLAQLLGAWGSAASASDLNGDGEVGGSDLPALLGSWGPCGF